LSFSPHRLCPFRNHLLSSLYLRSPIVPLLSSIVASSFSWYLDRLLIVIVLSYPHSSFFSLLFIVKCLLSMFLACDRRVPSGVRVSLSRQMAGHTAAPLPSAPSNASLRALPLCDPGHHPDNERLHVARCRPTAQDPLDSSLPSSPTSTFTADYSQTYMLSFCVPSSRP
jgi:hypothetical protein